MSEALTLVVNALSREIFAPFGDVIETRGASQCPINEGTSQRFHDLASIDVLERGGRPLVNIFKAQPQPLPITIRALERHPLSSQAFMPLHGQRFLVVVAPRGDAILASDLMAFITDGTQGVNYHRGVWHHGLIALDEASDFLVIDRGGPDENCDVFRLKETVTIDTLPAR